MSSALSTAVSGINHAVARATHVASNIVNASSTGKNLDKNLVTEKQIQTQIQADAKVIGVVQQENKALLDITA